MIAAFRKDQPSSQLFNIFLIILIVTHLVGVFGFGSNWRALFLSITPFHLLLVLGTIIIFQESKDAKFFAFAGFVWISSFLMELLGVQTGRIFGEYQYGEVLGWKIFGTPILIGALWFSLVYSIGFLLKDVNLKPWLKSILGALLMVVIDMAIEPVAIMLTFWTWNNDVVPLQNYVAWFLISWVYFVIFFSNTFAENRIAKFIYPLQLVFFILILLLVK